MRTVLFRGKLISDGTWRYGFLTQNKGKSWIGSFAFDNYYFAEVQTETVGQYTGLNDKDGNKVFENDIIRYINHHEKGHPYYVYHAVKWSNKYNMWYCFHTKNNQEEGIQGNCFLYAYAKASPSFERIGNIHDNPELL